MKSPRHYNVDAELRDKQGKVNSSEDNESSSSRQRRQQS